MTEAPKRLYSLQYIRGFAALLVVIYHAAGIIGAPEYNNDKRYIDAVDGIDRGVDVFFVLSGFVLAMSIATRKTSPSPHQFLVNRVLRIWPLGAITVVLYFVLQSAAGTYDFADDFTRFVTSFFLIPYEGTSIPVVLWSLKQELLFYIVFTAVYVNRQIGLGLVAAWALASLFITGESAIGRAIFHPQNVQFLIGIVCFWLTTKLTLTPKVANLVFPASLVLFLVVTIAPERQGNLEVAPAILFGLAGGLIIVSGYFTNFQVESFKRLGDVTLSLYLIHFLVLSGMIRVAQRSPIDIPTWMLLIGLSVGGVISGFLFYPLERKIENWRKEFDYGRRTSDLRPSVTK